jgi:alpha-tubulin suppressor-like RCC1 family protein
LKAFQTNPRTGQVIKLSLPRCRIGATVGSCIKKIAIASAIIRGGEKYCLRKAEHFVDDSMQQVPGGHLISCGGYHAAAITSEGKVVCWGQNNDHQCDVPAELDSEAVVALSCGGSHTAALTASGNVVCWGLNRDGQCNVPPILTYGGNGIAISCGYDGTCAVTRQGNNEKVLLYWGPGGLEYYVRIDAPHELIELASLSAGSCSSHTAAINSEGVIVCWGDNNAGQCYAPEDLPVVTSVACGGEFTVALTAYGEVVCWGDNYSYQCEMPGTLQNVTAIAAGEDHTAALTRDGEVICWGGNEFGQCDVPAGLANVIFISCGDCLTLAVTNEGSVVVWGSGSTDVHNVPEGLVVGGTVILL